MRETLAMRRVKPRTAGWLATVKSLPGNGAKLPRYGREGAVEVRPFPAKKRLLATEAQGLSGEAVKGNRTTVIPGVDESKPFTRTRRPGRTEKAFYTHKPAMLCEDTQANV